MWIIGLISKLIKARIPAQCTHIVHKYRNNTAFTVVHGNSETTRCSIRPAVAQTTLFGPLLFITYLDDIPSVGKDINVAVTTYAVGTNVTVRSGSVQLAVNYLSNVIKTLQPLFERWRIKVKVGKCSTTLFSKRAELSSLQVFRTNISWSDKSNTLALI